MDLDCAKGVKSSVSIDWRELHMNYTAISRSVHIRYTYADSSFAKGAFGAFGRRKSPIVMVAAPNMAQCLYMSHKALLGQSIFLSNLPLSFRNKFQKTNQKFV